jgi:hypothetical protein
MARMPLAADQRRAGVVLGDDALYDALHEAAVAYAEGRGGTVTVQLNDGNACAGTPRLVHLGTVPILILRRGENDTFVPVERATAITCA